MMAKNKIGIYLLLALAVFFWVNFLSEFMHARWDLTQDHRYTLSQTSKDIMTSTEEPILVEVFLAGDFPPAFRKLEQETQQLLEEYHALNPNLQVEFRNPVPEGANAETIATQFNAKGMRPERVQLTENGKVSQELVFPWATATLNGKSIPIPLLKKSLGAATDAMISRSTQNLEYAFTDAFSRLIKHKSKRIAVLKGNGELPDRYIADFFGTLRESYYIAPFPLDSMAIAPENTFRALQKFDLVVVAKPTVPFTESQKYALDQYIMEGGKSLWLLDMTTVETDSLYSNQGTTVGMPRDLNLNDLFFKHGLRIEPALVQDLYAAPLVLATGEGLQSQYQQVPWFYYPLGNATGDHPITTNLDNQVRFNYASPIELLGNDLQKIVLLQTSPLSKRIGLPRPISLDEATLEPDPTQFDLPPQNLAVLVEGRFKSAFENRVKPLNFEGIRFRESVASPNKMIVVADGDVIKNDLDKSGRPLELGFDKLTYAEYGNKEFLLNAVNYLLDDSGLINIRSRSVALPALDAQSVVAFRRQWQALMIGLPLLVVALFGLVFTYLRSRRYR